MAGTVFRGISDCIDVFEVREVDVTHIENKVSLLNDLSGNNYHVAQGTEANKPTYILGSDGFPVIRFDGDVEDDPVVLADFLENVSGVTYDLANGFTRIMG